MPRSYREQALSGQVATTLNALWEAPMAGSRLIVPDGSTDLLVEGETGEVHVVGAMTRAFRVPAGAQALFGVRLQPWAAFSWLGVAASELVDAKLPLREVAPRLAARLAGVASARALVAQLVTVAPSHPADPRVGRVVRGFHGALRVEHAARAAGVTERQLGRLFKQHVGLAPKELFRALRLQTAIGMERASLAQAAAHAGYADQAHLCRDARKLAGMSASELRSEVRHAMSDSSKPVAGNGLKFSP